ncbi:hypothetical protein CPB84DRAFT_1847011 [Gymnopilus junonius]|uniref:Uncharacterized protein n=1 Tax=Gymnopilus junonius TaxID=109634 RepID=A0A9P5NNM0_GYMJU|nr:hypothetical protein CPB84DRAFT_1847011 [Gymnopilus junonius]
MPEPVAAAVTVATATIVKAGYDVVVPIATKKFNGRAHTLEGGKLMDEMMRILGDPALSKDMRASTKFRFLQDHQALESKRQALERSTSTMIGSILHSSYARDFHSLTAWTNDQLMIASTKDPKRSRHVETTGGLGEAEVQAQERPSQRREGHLHNGPAQESELKIRDVQDSVYAQRQPASHKRGDSGPDTSEAEAHLRAILSPGGKKF